MDAPLGVWSIIVELTLPVIEEDIAVKYEGDAECDFANRGVERLRPKLNEMTDGGKAMGYQILRHVNSTSPPTAEELASPIMWARRCVA